jgi:hypothetical protein
VSCCLAIALSACSGAERRQASALAPAAPARASSDSGAHASTTPTLDGMRRNGFVQCGVSTGIAGFSATDAQVVERRVGEHERTHDFLN